jgi:aspartate racemase
MPKHIGIVGCSAEGAALCYRTICLEAETLMGRHAHPEVTMHTISLAEYMKYLQADYDWRGIGDLMVRSAEALQRAGADFLICPDNTIHQAMAHACQGRHCHGCTLLRKSGKRPVVGDIRPSD